MIMITAVSLPLRAAANGSTTFANPVEGGLSLIIGNIITFLLMLGIPLALLALIYGGVLLTVGGFDNERTAASGKRIIVWALVGTAVLLLSAVILNTFARTILNVP